MTIRTRLTLWYSGMLLGSLVLMSGVLYYELVYEHRREVPRERRETVDKQMSDILLFYGAPTLTLLLVGGWLLMRRTLAPVSTLTVAAERVRAENLRERLARTGNGDELDRLTGVLNDMLGRLDDSFQHIWRFALHASHELKTPLTIMGGEIETLLRDGACSAAQREMLTGHLDEIRRLARVVDDLALLTRGGSGLVPLAREPVRLDELVRESVEDARVLGEPAEVKVELADCAEVTVTGDRHRLRQLLLNLADNAVKHNQPGGSVRLGLRHSGGEACLEMANTGPGIPAEQIPFVFDPFFRALPAQQAQRDGCGLGLSIAQWIVQAHAGTIAITSEPGVVTTVTVRLPLAAESGGRQTTAIPEARIAPPAKKT